MTGKWIDEDYTVTNGIISSPDAFAREFVKRPGMHIGEASFERAVGFVQGLEHALFLRVRTPEDFATLPTHRYWALMNRQPGDDGAATARLEPVIAAVITALHQASA